MPIRIIHPSLRKYSPVFLAYPAYAGLADVISGTRGTLMTNGVISNGGITSSSDSNGGAYWTALELLKRITNRWTILVYANPSSIGAYAHLMSVAAAGTWASPYAYLSLRRDNINTYLQSYFYDGTNRGISASANSITTSDGMSLYSLTMDAGTATFRRNATAFGSGNNGTGVVSWGTLYQLTIGNRYGADAGEGMSGTFMMAALFADVLSESLIDSIYRDPSALVEPYYFPLSSAPSAASIIPRIMHHRRQQGMS